MSPTLQRSRLVRRIIIINLASIVTIALLLSVIRYFAPAKPIRSDDLSRFVAMNIANKYPNKVAVKTEADRVLQKLNMSFSLYLAPGSEQLFYSNQEIPPDPLPARFLALLQQEKAISLPGGGAVAVVNNDQLLAYGLFFLQSDGFKTPPNELHGIVPAALVLLCLAAASVFFANALTKQISGLAKTAESLGAGDLNARANILYDDELGELASGFNHMAERLSHLIRAQKEFLANVSHELRTPLSRIQVAMDIASEGRPERAQECLADISEDLQELQQLVEDIITTARLDLAAGHAGNVAPPLRLVDVSPYEIIKKSEARFRSMAPERDFAVVVDQDLPLLLVDPTMIRRAIDNLLDNARKYSSPETTITLRTSDQHSHVQIEVINQGPGLSEKELQKLFTPFYRAKRKGPKTKGLGLGLALVRRIVEAHGGTIEAESTQEKGTIFRFFVPKRHQSGE